LNSFLIKVSFVGWGREGGLPKAIYSDPLFFFFLPGRCELLKEPTTTPHPTSLKKIVG